MHKILAADISLYSDDYYSKQIVNVEYWFQLDTGNELPNGEWQ